MSLLLEKSTCALSFTTKKLLFFLRSTLPTPASRNPVMVSCTAVKRLGRVWTRSTARISKDFTPPSHLQCHWHQKNIRQWGAVRQGSPRPQ